MGNPTLIEPMLFAQGYVFGLAGGLSFFGEE